MTHREFLIWLKPQLENAGPTGLAHDGVRAVLEELTRMSKAGALQPFASRLLSLVREHATLDGETVAGLAADIRSELAPAREKTMVSSATPENNEK